MDGHSQSVLPQEPFLGLSKETQNDENDGLRVAANLSVNLKIPLAHLSHNPVCFS